MEQQEEEDTATVTMYNFDTSVDLVYRARPIEEAPKLDTANYTPGGRTALYDAIATAVGETADHIEGLSEADRPDTVIVVVLTDGKENASETPQENVHERVEHCREEGDWEFLFIGANQDAALTASSMGMDSDSSLDMNHSGKGTRAAYSSTSERISRARRKGHAGGFDEEYRRRQDKADES